MTFIPIFHFLLRLLASPSDDGTLLRTELASAIVSVTDDPQEQRQLAKIARYESSLRRDVADCRLLGKAGERGAWQIRARGAKERDRLCVSFADDARIALERIRESTRACRSLPPDERLSVYTRGSCRSVEGRRLSKTRFAP